MWIILGFFLSMSVFALEPFEVLKNVKILRVLPNNIVMLNRGIEDGLIKNDHIKISNEVDGFGSRAICIKISATTSYWRLYRVPNGNAFSLDYTYTIQGIANREIPFPEANILDTEHKISEVEIKKEEQGPNPLNVKRDLPERLTERDLINATGPDKRKLVVEEAINQERFKRDFTDYRLSVYASPFTRQSINEGESYRYGFRGGNIASKYRFTTQFDQQQSKLKDPLTDASVSTRSTAGQAQFVIHRLKKNVSTLTLLNYNSFRFSSLATPKNHWQVGAIGFTWHLYESKSLEYFDLSYIPLIDVRETDTIDNKTKTKKIVKKSGLRHGFKFAMKSKINERISFENLLWFRPFQDPSNWAIKGDDMNLTLDLKVIFNLASNFYFDYNLIFMRDILWRELNDLPENNVINSLNFRYDFEFN